MRFTKDHEWIELTGDIATVGITAYAAEQLGDVVFVELPEVGKTVKAGDPLAVVESVKAASDIYAPYPAGDGGERPHPVDAGNRQRDAGEDGWFASSSPPIRPRSTR